eukprot:CAMPEP_0173101376 /NCGR_PEP_ID=MMETSP1102-20130122/36808_1 /TAXON_ID=49646 /ORGANISM="Geminigera sp., Strain Caron Lab Isolate" /LENGTH=72 /DNA_ID=CAMNT_0013995089 /DNA_START=111 /DNA_END=326 /DNA_ORIENTATION=-
MSKVILNLEYLEDGVVVVAADSVVRGVAGAALPGLLILDVPGTGVHGRGVVAKEVAVGENASRGERTHNEIW